MADSLIFDMAQSAGDSEFKPFVKKEMVFITDQSSSGNYSNGQIVFETSQLSNNGRWCDYGMDSYFSFPIMLTCTMATQLGVAIDWTGANPKASDYLVALKNSNYNIINTMQVEYGNNSVLQQTSGLNQYINFRLNTEMDAQDEALNGPTIGYARDTSTSWRYESAAVGSSYGRGLCNNANSALKPNSASEFYGECTNDGMFRRQLNYQKTATAGVVQAIPNGRDVILGNDNTRIKNSGQNYTESTAAYKVWYYDCILRLRDLPFFQKLPPLLRGSYMKVTFGLNQIFFQVTKDNAGNLNYLPATTISNGTCNPVMVAAGVASFSSNCVVVDETIANAKLDVAVNLNHIPCGSACIPVGAAANNFTLLSISCCVGKNYFPAHAGLGLLPAKSQCRWYIPTYVMNPISEGQYITLGQKTVKYIELFSYPVYNLLNGQNFTTLISNGLARMKRLIIMPYISQNSHGSENAAATFSVLNSPFTCEPSCVSPNIISNWNVQLGGINVYPNPISMSYELYLQEMNGNYGVNSNKTMGLCSSRISQIDYNNTYGYLVCDLSRRLPEDDTTSISLSISGTNSGAKPLDLFCYIEYERQITIDLTTGKLLNL